MIHFENLNEKEISVLKAISISSDYNGGDFTYFVDVIKLLPKLNELQLKGYLSQLSQKGYIAISSDKSTQIFSGKYVDFLTEYQF